MKKENNSFKTGRRCKKMKRLVIGLVMLLTTILTAIYTYGAVTCAFDQTATTAGTSSTYIRGTAKNLSVNLTVGDPGINATTAVISAGATGCTISGALTFNRTDSPGNWSYMNTTVNTLAMRDDTTCTFTMTVKNVTNQNNLATCTRDFISDNSVPVCTLVKPLSSTSYKPTQTFEITGTNASSSTLKFGNNNPESMTESTAGDTFTLTSTLGIPEATYDTVTGTTSDGLNLTTCTSSYVKIDRDATVQLVTIGLSQAAAASKKMAEVDTGSQVIQQNNARRNTFLIIGLAVIAVIYFKRRK